jgi:hypothetical protein
VLPAVPFNAVAVVLVVEAGRNSPQAGFSMPMPATMVVAPNLRLLGVADEIRRPAQGAALGGWESVATESTSLQLRRHAISPAPWQDARKKLTSIDYAGEIATESPRGSVCEIGLPNDAGQHPLCLRS